jgi:ABC-type transport system substrate-binding protein
MIPGWPNDRANAQRLLAGFTIFEPLVKLDPDGNPNPWLATGWEWGPNNTYITFTLRQGVKFHDGTTFTAEAVKLEADQVIEIKESNAVNWDRWEILDDYHIRLYLKKYENNFWTTLAGINMMFFSPTAYKEHGIDWMKEHPIGTGPFKFESFEKGVHLKLVKNPDYWQKGKPYLDGITVLFVKELLTRLTAMQSGEGDMVTSVEGKDLADMKSKGFKIIARMDGTGFIMFDTMNANSIFRDARIRQAIEYAIDKQAIVDAMGYGYMAVNNQMTPPQYASHNKNLPSREYNLEKAKQLLAEAGYPQGFKTRIITMGGAQPKALAVQEFLKAVNIDATVDLVDNAKFWDYMMKGWENAMVVTDYASDISFPAWLRAYFPPTSTIDVSVKLPDEVIKKIDPALAEPDPVKAKQLSDELIRLIWEDCSYIPIYSNAMGYVLSPKVHDTGFYEGYSFYTWNPESTWLDK